MTDATEAKTGDTVTVHYTGKLADGEVFDSSQGREPLSFTLGAGQIIPGFEKAVLGAKPGDKVTETFGPELAYGPHRPEMMLKIQRTQLPPDLNPEVGQMLQMQQPNAQPMPVRVVDVAEEIVTLDANHPLAGKELTFEIEIVKVGA